MRAGIYADDGISGTSYLKREAFLQMLEDCRNGKIDMILTKSVSRFVRNTVDALNTIRELKSLNIGVYFQKENIWIPEDNLDLRVRRDHVPYDVWEKKGVLQTTEGNVVHYGYIENFIESLGERYNIREIAFDRWGAVQMVQNLEGMGFPSDRDLRICPHPPRSLRSSFWRRKSPTEGLLSFGGTWTTSSSEQTLPETSRQIRRSQQRK